MRTWVRVLHSTVGAIDDARSHLEALARAEDSLTKAKTLEEFHFQRGRVQGIRDVLFVITPELNKKETS